MFEDVEVFGKLVNAQLYHKLVLSLSEGRSATFVDSIVSTRGRMHCSTNLRYFGKIKADEGCECPVHRFPEIGLVL